MSEDFASGVKAMYALDREEYVLVNEETEVVHRPVLTGALAGQRTACGKPRRRMRWDFAKLYHLAGTHHFCSRLSALTARASWTGIRCLTES